MTGVEITGGIEHIFLFVLPLVAFVFIGVLTAFGIVESTGTGGSVEKWGRLANFLAVSNVIMFTAAAVIVGNSMDNKNHERGVVSEVEEHYGVDFIKQEESDLSVFNVFDEGSAPVVFSHEEDSYIVGEIERTVVDDETTRFVLLVDREQERQEGVMEEFSPGSRD